MSRMHYAGLLAALIVATSASSVRADWWVQPWPTSSYYRATSYYYPVYSYSAYSYPAYSYPAYSYPTYSYPTYSYPTYSYPSYSYPTYSYPTYSYPTYYYPAYYYTPAPIIGCPAPVGGPMVSNGNYAQPTPAPASQTKEPPLVKKTQGQPQVSESRSFSIGDGKESPTLVGANGNEVCKVGFWNVSGRDVTLTVNGNAVVLPRNRSTTLTVSRAFAWQIDSRPSQQERVPNDQVTHEIVIR